ncbi:MAG: hypothetical protein NC395_02975 [Prevotella sp.]|nr:hypothetical protein [Prevotella sp.]
MNTNAEKTESIAAFDELMRLVNETPSVPDNTVYDTEKEERLAEKGLI